MRPDRKKEFYESVSSSKKFGRAERKAQPRQQLLEAARDVFRDGFMAANLDVSGQSTTNRSSANCRPNSRMAFPL
jgi:hypothetical protein